MKNSIFHFLCFCLIIALSSLTATDLRGQSEKFTSPEAYTTISDGNNGYVTGITSGRARSLVGGVLALASVIIGWRFRRDSPGSRTWVGGALVLGILAILLSVTHLAITTGGVGTGGGKAGAVVAIVLGTAGIVISGLVLRSGKQAQ